MKSIPRHQIQYLYILKMLIVTLFAFQNNNSRKLWLEHSMLWNVWYKFTN